MLAGRKVLVVDDDSRNIFALTSVLEQRGLKVLHAENGRAGIELLKTAPDVDIVLMDIMMPEMDGYETMRAIRAVPQFASLPIVALTAKAMKGDREKCLRAGASDYVTKPVDLELLFSVMRVWMARDMDNRFEHGAVALPTWLASEDLSIDDDRNSIKPGDSALLIVEDDIAFPHSGGRGARARNESAGGAARSKRHRAGEDASASRHYAGCAAAGHERLGGAGSTEARSGHAAHSGARGFRSGGTSRRILPGRHDVRAEGIRERGVRRVVFAGGAFHGSQGEAVCW